MGRAHRRSKRREMPVSDTVVQWLTDLEIPGMFWLLC